MKKLIVSLLITTLIFSIFSIFTINYAAEGTPTIAVEQARGTGNAYIGVKFKLENLDKDKKYEYAIIATNAEPGDSDWKSVYTDTDEETKSTIQYAVSSGNNQEVFRTQDHVYFSLRTVTYPISSNSYETVIDKQKCNLILPDFLAERIKLSGFLTTVSFKPEFGIKKGQYQFVKITDSNVIEKYKAYAKDKSEANLSALKAVIPEETDAPSTGWIDFVSGEDYDIPKETGFYYVWMKAHEENTITLTGINILEVVNKLDPDNSGSGSNSSSSNSSSSSSSSSTGKTTSGTDKTTATTILPKTGKTAIISFTIIGIVLIGLAIILHKRYKNMDR